MTRSAHRRVCLMATIACACWATVGCRVIHTEVRTGDETCDAEVNGTVVRDTADFAGEECDDKAPRERKRWLKERPFAGKFQEFKAKAADHFAEEPVVAPHPRFHPVPTRPVFAPIPPEELAVLLAPPLTEAEKAKAAEKSGEKSEKLVAPVVPGANGKSDAIEIKPETPPKAFEPPHVVSPPIDVSPSAPPTRTARPDLPATPVLLPTPAPTLKPASNSADEEHDAEADVVHSIFEPQAAEAGEDQHEIQRRVEHAGGMSDEPLLWRVVPTPAGSLRATPAE
jgi:hypothetical protein